MDLHVEFRTLEERLDRGEKRLVGQQVGLLLERLLKARVDTALTDPELFEAVKDKLAKIGKAPASLELGRLLGLLDRDPMLRRDRLISRLNDANQCRNWAVHHQVDREAPLQSSFREAVDSTWALAIRMDQASESMRASIRRELEDQARLRTSAALRPVPVPLRLPLVALDREMQRKRIEQALRRPKNGAIFLVYGERRQGLGHLSEFARTHATGSIAGAWLVIDDLAWPEPELPAEERFATLLEGVVDGLERQGLRVSPEPADLVEALGSQGVGRERHVYLGHRNTAPCDGDVALMERYFGEVIAPLADQSAGFAVALSFEIATAPRRGSMLSSQFWRARKQHKALQRITAVRPPDEGRLPVVDPGELGPLALEDIVVYLARLRANEPREQIEKLARSLFEAADSGCFDLVVQDLQRIPPV